jgi:hypothetical protein
LVFGQQSCHFPQSYRKSSVKSHRWDFQLPKLIRYFIIALPFAQRQGYSDQAPQLGSFVLASDMLYEI